MNRIQKLNIEFPIYLPDATKAITKSLDTNDLYNVGIEGIVVNTYHLISEPGEEVLKAFNGVKNFMNFNGLVVSDSGGWQVFSLIKRSNLPGKIEDYGVTFSIGNKSKSVLTPEKSIQMQFEIGSDIIICLDDFVSHKANYKQTKEAVDRTIHWAQRSRVEYDKLIEKHEYTNESRPLLFSVIQGGYEKELRKECAEKLIEIGFDGYGFGGYVVDEITNKMDLDISKYIADLIPNDKYKFALGVGKPEDIVDLYKMGWQIFDCTIPTRDARHKRLFVSNGENLKNYDFLYINKVANKNDNASIDANCDCLTCQNYSRAYLHHLFKIQDTTALRLATIHNLKYYTRLTNQLRAQKTI